MIVGQLPTTDWRDEQWVLGFGLYVNATVYAYLRLYGQEKRAALLRARDEPLHRPRRGQAGECGGGIGGAAPASATALWSYKIYSGDRFDLLGNSLAILSGLASQRGRAMVTWVENECEAMRKRYELAVDCPPNLFPYIRPLDFDWRPRYERFNRPGEYHNGGVWPFICAFYVVATLAAGFPRLADEKLAALTELVRPAGITRWGLVSTSGSRRKTGGRGGRTGRLGRRRCTSTRRSVWSKGGRCSSSRYSPLPPRGSGPAGGPASRPEEHAGSEGVRQGRTPRSPGHVS